VFYVGIIPALLLVFIRRGMVEPERFSAVAERRQALAAKREHTEEDREFMRFVPVQLFNRQNRYSTMVGLLFCVGTLLAIWTSNIWLPTIQRGILAKEGILDNAAIPFISYGMTMWSIGGIFGYAAFGFIADAIGRRPAILIYNIGTLAVGLTLYLAVDTFGPYPFLLFVFGFFVFGVFSGHAVYLPELFPTHVRAFVLDGAVDPNLSGVQLGVEQAVGFENALDAFLAQCAANPRCSFYNAGDPAGAFDRLAAQIDARPLRAGSRVLGGGEFDIGVAQALYTGKFGYRVLEQALAAAQRGDGDSTSDTAIPEGTRFRLPASLNIDALNLPRQTAMMAKAAQKYGIIVVDGGGAVAFRAEDPYLYRQQYGVDPYGYLFGGQWANQLLGQFPWAQLQVVQP